MVEKAEILDYVREQSGVPVKEIVGYVIAAVIPLMPIGRAGYAIVYKENDGYVTAMCPFGVGAVPEKEKADVES